MSDTGLERDATFLNEVWVLYAIGMSILVVRFAVRLKTTGFRGLQGDDLFSFLVMVMYTCDAATVHIVYVLGSNVEASSFQLTRVLSDEEIAQYTRGSKLQLIAWYSYTALLWCLKGTMLCFFKRITMGLWQARLVKWLMYACAVTYIAVVCTITFGCFPTYKNWQVVPDPGMKCTFRMQNFVVTVVLNVLTDAAILCIPLPLLWQLQVPLKKKFVVGLLICSGFFVIAAAIVRVALTLGANPSATNINRWGVRETIVGIIAVNIPILRPLFTKNFWKTGQITADIPSQGRTRNSGLTTTLSSRIDPYKITNSISDSYKNRGSFEIGDDLILDIEPSSVRQTMNNVVVHKSYLVSSEQNTGHSTNDWIRQGTLAKATAYKGANAV